MGASLFCFCLSLLKWVLNYQYLCHLNNENSNKIWIRFTTYSINTDKFWIKLIIYTINLCLMWNTLVKCIIKLWEKGIHKKHYKSLNSCFILLHVSSYYMFHHFLALNCTMTVRCLLNPFILYSQQITENNKRYFRDIYPPSHTHTVW